MTEIRAGNGSREGSGSRAGDGRGGAPFAARLLAWYEASRRDLPWRRSRDPWAIWVSEIMLQQTRVEAVREPFGRFLERFPTPASFAAASDDDLLLAWRGLGYYRRARLLRDGARAVVERHGGRVPADGDALAALPGIGAYTRGALASIAFDLPEPAVDGNVERVVTRHRGIDAPLGTSTARKAIRAVAEAWLDRDRPGDFNQAMMELGATVCTPTSPACERCPVAEDCVARAADRTAELPVRPARRAAVEVGARAILDVRGGQALGYRIPAGQANAGQVELPGPGVLVDTPAEDLRAALRARFGAVCEPGSVVATVRHAITHHRITLFAHATTVQKVGALSWFPLSDSTPWTTPSRKVFRQAVAHDGGLEA